jgi:WD40 repeat protein/serine/threonine protein kinase
MNRSPQNEESIFAAAIQKGTPAERAAYIERACEGDPELLEGVRALLKAHEEADSFFEPLARELPATARLPEISEGPGTVIGPYKLLQKIGEGGMGVVYMADQTEPVKRRVALKIIKPGMDTGQVIARFEAERQALAMMDHPNIAKVLDAGTTDSGRPFFVMDLVKGVPITQYCDEHNLMPRERLELFVPVCQAIQHAHQKGVIHRDIKPTNILVAEYDDRPVPKIIDFGVAKATEQRLTEKTMFTQYGQVVGTVDYMSPEQAKLNQLDIDTRSDIYSLGVLLYELLTGETPFDRQRLRSAAFDELLRIIREEEPPKPSLRLSTSQSLASIAANRHTEPRKLSTLVRGELDWIVMKAMEKDRTRRYETAIELATDVDRYLKNEPVEASPPSASYRLRKFAQKNKKLIATIALLMIILLSGSVVSTWMAVVAQKARAQANDNLEEAYRQKEVASQARDEADRDRMAADEARRDIARRLYLSDMNRVEQAYEDGNIGLTISLLQKHIPVGEGEEERRGFDWYHWWHRAHSHARTIVGPRTWGCASLVTAPDGKTIAAGFPGRWVLIYDLLRGEEVQRLGKYDDGGFVSLAYVRDGTVLAGACGDSQVYLWDTSTWEPLSPLRLPTNPSEGGTETCRELAVSPDGKTLACGTEKGRVFLCDTATWEMTGPLIYPGFIRGLAFAADGMRLFAGGAHSHTRSHGVLKAPVPGQAVVWDLASQETKECPQLHPWVIAAVAQSPTTNRLATGSADGTVVVWNANTLEPMNTLKIRTPVEALAFSRDGRMLAAGTKTDNSVYIWDLESQSLLAKLKGHTREVTAITFLDDGKTIVVGSIQGGLRVWDIEKLQTQNMARGDFSRLGYSPDGEILYAISATGDILTFDAASGAPVSCWKHKGRFENAAFSDDMRTIVAVDAVGVLRAWQLPEQTLRWEREQAFDGRASFGLAITRDATVLAWDEAVEDGHQLVVADTDSGKRVLKKASRPFVSLRFSPDSRYLVSVDGGSGLQIWDLRGKNHAHATNPYPAVAFSEDGSRLAIGDWPNSVSVFDTRTWERVVRLEGHASRVTSVAFLDDGETVVSGSEDCTVRIWDIGSGELRSTLRGHTGTVRGIAVAPGNRSVATCALDGTLRFWRAAEPVGENEAIEIAARAQPKPKRISLWEPDDVDFASLIEQARQRAARDEWLGAAQQLTEAIQRIPRDSLTWYDVAYDLAFYQVYLKQFDAFEELCGQMSSDCRFADEYSRASETTQFSVAERTAKACLFSRYAEQLDAAVRENAITLATNTLEQAQREDDLGMLHQPRSIPYKQLVVGIAEYRRNNWRLAMGHLEACADTLPDDLGGVQAMYEITARLFLAMSHERIGRGIDARRLFAEASRRMSGLSREDREASPTDWIMCQVVHQEAKEFILSSEE